MNCLCILTFYPLSLGENAIQLSKAWESLPQDKKEEYGQDYFIKAHKIASTALSIVSHDPKNVVSRIVSIVQQSNPPGHAYIGIDAKIVPIILRFVPVTVVDWLIGRYFRIMLGKPASLSR